MIITTALGLVLFYFCCFNVIVKFYFSDNEDLDEEFSYLSNSNISEHSYHCDHRVVRHFDQLMTLICCKRATSPSLLIFVYEVHFFMTDLGDLDINLKKKFCQIGEMAELFMVN